MLMAVRRYSGFSMIEMAVVLVVLGALLALAVPSFRAWVHNSQVRNAAEEIQNGLQQARVEAVQRNATVSYDLTLVVAGSTRATRTVTPTGTTQVGFNGLGRRVAPAGANFSVDISSPEGGNCISAGGRVRCLRVVVTLAGQVLMCDPSRAAGQPQGCPS